MCLVSMKQIKNGTGQPEFDICDGGYFDLVSQQCKP